MGNAVSSGVNNDDLVNNLVEEKYITSKLVEQVFRAVDRGHFVASDSRDNESNSTSSAYDDLAWREGNLHLSAPCIYTHVMEELDLEPGMSFLNLGSGTGYLSLMVGHIIGPLGSNHGIEIHSDCIEYAKERINAFIRTSKHFDKFNIGFPEFFQGNCLCLASDNFSRYDRVYCGAAVPAEHIAFIRQFVKPGGILILPCEDQLVKVLVKEEDGYEMQNILPVSFASLVVPSGAEAKNNSVQLPLKQVPTLKSLVRVAIRKHIQNLTFPEGVLRVKPSPLTRSEKAKRSQMSVRESFMRVRGRLRNRPEPGTNQNRDRRPNMPDSNNEGELAASEMEPLLRPENNNGTISNENRESSIADAAPTVSTENGSQESNNVPSVTSSDEKRASAESSSDCLVNDDCPNQTSTSKERSSSDIPHSSTGPDGDGESSNDSLDKNFKLFTVENGKTTVVDGEQGTSSGANIETSESTLACNTRDASADSQDGRPNEPKRIRMTSATARTNQSEPETPNASSDDQTSSNIESFCSNAGPDTTVQSAHGDDSSNVETRTSASTYDLEIDEISEPGNPVEVLHNEIVSVVRSTFTEDPDGVPFPIRFLLDAHRINLDPNFEENNPRMATESSDLDQDNGDGDDLESEDDSEVSCEDVNDYDETIPGATSGLPVNVVGPKNDAKLSCSNDSGFKTLSSTYSNEAQNSSPDEITCARRKRKKGKRDADVKKDDSGLWVRQKIEKLDLPQFLIDYLLFNRKA